MASLLDIADDMKALAALFEEATTDDGELDPSLVSEHLDKWFQEIGEQQTVKVDSYCALIRQKELEASVLTEEIERLQMRQAARTNLAKRLKERLKTYLEMTGQQRLACKRFTASICKNGGKAPLDCMVTPEQLPPSLHKVTTEIDRDKIRLELEAGRMVQGCKILERGTHIRIS